VRSSCDGTADQCGRGFGSLFTDIWKTSSTRDLPLPKFILTKNITQKNRRPEWDSNRAVTVSDLTRARHDKCYALLVGITLQDHFGGLGVRIIIIIIYLKGIECEAKECIQVGSSDVI
jgi:hypothetical protein